MSAKRAGRGDGLRATDPPAMVPPSALKSPALVSRAAMPGQRPAMEFRFFRELKRRNVLRVGVLYIIVCWLMLAPVHVAFNMLELPKWAIELVLAVMAGGFPVALGLAWAFELTP